MNHDRCGFGIRGTSSKALGLTGTMQTGPRGEVAFRQLHHFQGASYAKSKLIRDSGLAPQTTTNPPASVQILNYPEDSPWLDCGMLL